MYGLSLLSKYRSQLMGIAIMMVMFYHMESFLLPSFLMRLFGGLNIGVDFFLVLSAIGCYFSLENKAGVMGFYRRRVVRLLPAVYIGILIQVAVSYLITHRFSLSATVWKLSLLDLFRNNLSIWFITHIVICYLAMPFLYKLTKMEWGRWFLPCLCVAIFVLLVVFVSSGAYINVSLYRYPIFIVSVFLATCIKERCFERMSSRFIWLSAGAAIIAYGFAMFLNPWSYMFVVFFVIAVPLLVFLAFLLEKINSPGVLRVLGFMGGISLELYMLHQYVCMYVAEYFLPQHPVWAMVCSVVGAIIGAYLLNRGVRRFFCSRGGVLG